MRLLLQGCLIASMVFVSSYCTQNNKKTENVQLSQDETYLVQAYLRLAEARDARSVTYETSESLFVALGASIDTARVSRTIRALDADPERWILIFRNIERAMGSEPEAERPSKRRR